MNTPIVRVRSVELGVNDRPARVPFGECGDATRWAPQITARVTLQIDRKHVEGYSADLMLPGWLDRDDEKTPRGSIEDLARSARDAGWAFEGAGSGTLFDVWHRARAEHLATGDDAGVLEFGVSLVERAAIDAVCRAGEMPFLSALKWNVFGFDPGAVYRELADWNMSMSVPSVLAKRIRVRHTIGWFDPLRPASPEPVHRSEHRRTSLEEHIAGERLDCFKVMLSGELEADLARIHELSELLPRTCGSDFDVALDGNGRYTSVEAVRALLERMPPGFSQHVEYIIQPLANELAFDADVASIAKPIVLDRADTTIDAFPRAREVGYDAVTVRMNKGVFRALLSRGLCIYHRLPFQTSEDIASLPGLALQQNLALVSALGLPDHAVSGHRHFDGVSVLPAAETAAALEAHGDLYESQAGGLHPRVANGAVGLGSIRCAGFGYAFPVDFASRTVLADWTPDIRGAVGQALPDC